MITQLNSFDIYLYAIHIKPSASSPHDPSTEINPARVSSTGTLIGSCGLRTQGDLKDCPPLPHNPHLVSSSSNNDALIPSKPVPFRILGYALFESAWGKGYATEAVSALMASFESFNAAKRADAKKNGADEVWTFVKAEVDYDNPASSKVMEKMGFENLGKVVEKGGKMFLGGQWRDPVFWVYGKWA
jgi:RimJ/RimL family protein N-acetyltransferase